MITCFLRYQVDPAKLSEFRVYAAQWLVLVQRFGGLHHGYFLPSEGANDIALALFSFPSLAEYEKYRLAAADDPECERAYRKAQESGCIINYKRIFFQAMLPCTDH